MSEDMEKKQKAPRAAKGPAKEERAGAVIYIGPDVPGAKQYTVYDNGLPHILEKAIARHPEFAPLVIPVSELPQANIQLTREGSALNNFYKMADEYRFILEEE